MQSKSQIKYIFQNKENPWKIKKILKFNKKKWSISKRLLKKSIRNVSKRKPLQKLNNLSNRYSIKPSHFNFLKFHKWLFTLRRKMAVLYGFVSFKKLKKQIRKNKKRYIVELKRYDTDILKIGYLLKINYLHYLVKNFEELLAWVLVRVRFVKTIKKSINLIQNGFVCVNGFTILNIYNRIREGDFIHLNKKGLLLLQKYVYKKHKKKIFFNKKKKNHKKKYSFASNSNNNKKFLFNIEKQNFSTSIIKKKKPVTRRRSKKKKLNKRFLQSIRQKSLFYNNKRALKHLIVNYDKFFIIYSKELNILNLKFISLINWVFVPFIPKLKRL